MKHWTHWLPGIDTLRRYEAAWLPHDIVAGLVLATMLVPVGIAYAVASGLPGIHGLYATIVPLLVYALFGPSASSFWDRTRHWQLLSSALCYRCLVAILFAPRRSLP